MNEPDGGADHNWPRVRENGELLDRLGRISLLDSGVETTLIGHAERTLKRVVPTVAVIYCLASTALIFIIYASRFANDFDVYWRTARLPIEQVYFWKGRFPFPYAPTMLLWISPLALIPKWVGYSLLVSSSVAAMVLACRHTLPMRAIVLTLISPSVARGLFAGQVCALLAALMIWSCRTSNRLAAGVAFGIIASIKPQLVVMAPLMLALNRDWRAFTAAGATFLSIVFLSVALFGPERWSEWLASMNHFYHSVVDTGVITISTTPASIAERFGYPPLPFLVLGIIFGAAIVYICRDAEPLGKAAAVGLGSIMASPYALAYDLTVVMPVLALAVFRGRILAAVGLAAPHPLPLIISIYELVRTRFASLEIWKTRNHVSDRKTAGK